MKQLLAIGVALVLASSTACTGGSPGVSGSGASPLAPTVVGTPGPARVASAHPEEASLSNSHGHLLTAVVGQGRGTVNVTSQESQPFFVAEIEAAIEQTSPGSTFSVRRRIDPTPDGTCTGAAFFTWSAGDFTTSPGGAGATQFEFQNPHALRPFKFDMQIEVSTADASTVLQSDCFTVDVK